MPVGKESIKRAAAAGTKKKTTMSRKTPEKKTVQDTVLVPDEQVNAVFTEKKKEGPVRITEELPVYLL